MTAMLVAVTGCEIIDNSDSHNETSHYDATNGTVVVMENSDGSSQEITTDNEGNKTIVMKDSDGSVQAVVTTLNEEEGETE